MADAQHRQVFPWQTIFGSCMRKAKLPHVKDGKCYWSRVPVRDQPISSLKRFHRQSGVLIIVGPLANIEAFVHQCFAQSSYVWAASAPAQVGDCVTTIPRTCFLLSANELVLIRTPGS